MKIIEVDGGEETVRVEPGIQVLASNIQVSEPDTVPIVDRARRRERHRSSTRMTTMRKKSIPRKEGKTKRIRLEKKLAASLARQQAKLDREREREVKKFEREREREAQRLEKEHALELKKLEKEHARLEKAQEQKILRRNKEIERRRAIEVKKLIPRERGGASVPCPTCGESTRVLATRRANERWPGNEGEVWRLRICKNKKCKTKLETNEHIINKHQDENEEAA